MTIDAMEHVPPEDWPAVVGEPAPRAQAGRALLHDARGGRRRLDVEEAFRELSGARTAGRPRARSSRATPAAITSTPAGIGPLGWLRDAGFELVAEDADWRDDWGYRHLLLRRRPEVASASRCSDLGSIPVTMASIAASSCASGPAAIGVAVDATGQRGDAAGTEHERRDGLDVDRRVDRGRVARSPPR